MHWSLGEPQAETAFCLMMMLGKLINQRRLEFTGFGQTFYPRQELSSGIVVSGKKCCPSGGRTDGRAGVTLSFPDHCAKTIILTVMKFGTYLGLML